MFMLLLRLKRVRLGLEEAWLLISRFVANSRSIQPCMTTFLGSFNLKFAASTLTYSSCLFHIFWFVQSLVFDASCDSCLIQIQYWKLYRTRLLQSSQEPLSGWFDSFLIFRDTICLGFWVSRFWMSLCRAVIEKIGAAQIILWVDLASSCGNCTSTCFTLSRIWRFIFKWMWLKPTFLSCLKRLMVLKTSWGHPNSMRSERVVFSTFQRRFTTPYACHIEHLKKPKIVWLPTSDWDCWCAYRYLFVLLSHSFMQTKILPYYLTQVFSCSREVCAIIRDDDGSSNVDVERSMQIDKLVRSFTDSIRSVYVLLQSNRLQEWSGTTCLRQLFLRLNFNDFIDRWGSLTAFEKTSPPIRI